MLNRSSTIQHHRIPPANKLEALTGNRKEQHSIHINDHWQIAKEKLAVDVARNQVLPQVDLFASYKLVGQGKSYGKANDLDGKEYEAGLLFSYPFYNIAFTENLHQTRRDLKKLELRLKDLETELVNSFHYLKPLQNLPNFRLDTSKRAKRKAPL